MKSLLFLFVALLTVISMGACEKQTNLHYQNHHEMDHLPDKNSHDVTERDIDGKTPKSNYPCPNATDIAPCQCTRLPSNYSVLYMDCTYAQNETQIAEAFQQDFPLKTFYRFDIFYTFSIVNLDFSTNGVSFEEFHVLGYNEVEPSTIRYVSERVFRDSISRLASIGIQHTMLEDGGFPFDALSGYPKLSYFNICGSSMTEIPSVVSDTITNFVFCDNEVTVLEPGTLSGLPNLSDFFATENKLSKLQAGSVTFGEVPFTAYLSHNVIDTIEEGAFSDRTPDGSGKINMINLEFNSFTELTARTLPLTLDMLLIDVSYCDIATIEPGTFYIHSEPRNDSVRLDFTSNRLTTIDEAVFSSLMPYIEYLRFDGNPIVCNCNIAWLVTNPDYLPKVQGTCVNGNTISELQPGDFSDC